MTSDAADTTHYITIEKATWSTRGEVILNLVCTAAPGASCRKRPTDEREEWTLDDPDLIDGQCWAAEWVQEGGWETVATDHDEIGRVPVDVEYIEGVLVSPVAPHPTLPTGSAAA